jgi:hypothetical protein
MGLFSFLPSSLRVATRRSNLIEIAKSAYYRIAMAGQLVHEGDPAPLPKTLGAGLFGPPFCVSYRARHLATR